VRAKEKRRPERFSRGDQGFMWGVVMIHTGQNPEASHVVIAAVKN
jgi:hypothetical protein